MGRKSQGQIEREAARLMRRSSRLFPHLDPIAALLEEARNGNTITGSTIRRYRPSYRFALTSLDPINSDTLYIELNEQLGQRRGTPDPQQGASSKVTHVTKEDARRTFNHLKSIVLKSKSRSAMAAALYVLVVSRVGVRPIELPEAEVVGQELRVRNAKWRRGLPLYRSISLTRFPDTLVEATKWLCILAQQGVGSGSEETREVRFELWRNRVAESLARASETVLDDTRLSLYSFRHLGIATWKSAGFSEAEIAAMAGHLNLKSAGKHYAPASSGWAQEAVLAGPGAQVPIPIEAEASGVPVEHSLNPSAAEAITARTEKSLPQAQRPVASTSSAAPPKPGLGIDVNDFPIPDQDKVERRDGIDFGQYRKKLEAQASEALRSAERLKSKGAPGGPETESINSKDSG